MLSGIVALSAGERFQYGIFLLYASRFKIRFFYNRSFPALHGGEGVIAEFFSAICIEPENLS
jgi:hypothetical protein